MEGWVQRSQGCAPGLRLKKPGQWIYDLIFRGYNGIMENRMETTIMENQMEN